MRKTVLLAGLVLLLAFGAVMGWRVAYWHRIGWTGLLYQPAAPPGMKTRAGPSFGGPFAYRPGRIAFLVPDSPAALAGIEQSDIIRSVDGLTIDRIEDLHALSERTHRGDPVDYELVRNGVTRHVRVRTASLLTMPSVVLSLGVTCVIAVVYILISIFVYWNRPRSRSAWVFFWLCIVGAASFGISALLDIDASTFSGIEVRTQRIEAIALYIGAFVAAFSMTTLLLHLALVFPKERPILTRQPRFIEWLCGVLALPAAAITAGLLLAIVVPSRFKPPLGIVMIVLALAGLIWLWRGTERQLARLTLKPWHVLGLLWLSGSGMMLALVPLLRRTDPIIIGILLVMVIGGIYFTLFFAYTVATLVALARSYRSSSIDEKRQVRWPLWGTATAVSVSASLALMMVILSSMQPMPQWRFVVFLGAFSRATFVLIPLSFAFAILKYRLMDIDVIIKKTVVYTVVTALIIAAFFLVVAGLGTALTTALHVRSQTVTVIATLVVALAFVPFRNRVQQLVDRRMFRRKYDAAEAQKLIQREILNATDLQPLLTRIAEYVQHPLQVRSVVILCPAENPELFVPAASIGVAEALLRQLELDREAIPSVAKVVPATSMRLGERDHERLRRMQVEYAAPAILRGQLRGVILAGSMLSGSYDDDDREFLTASAEQVALAIDNLAVTDEARDYERALEIQRALVPRSMPRVEGVDLDAMWQPAKTVGGDYYDLFRLGPQLALCIGDVAGKGMPAALLMANLQAAVKATAREEMPPGDVCARVSDVVCGTLSGGRFVTFFYAVLDPRTLLLRYCNAGHNPPLVVKGDGRVVRLSAGGPVFARLMRSSPYLSSEEQLERGDVLVLFTDGVTEARNAEEEELGDDRLIDLVRRSARPAATIVRDIANAVTEFSAGIAYDDVTVVCVRL
ncbi:MAG: rsbU 6 [Acidobacteria bacterium]|nr:rsbU 6 [Acidobacteriota bacterium]